MILKEFQNKEQDFESSGFKRETEIRFTQYFAEIGQRVECNRSNHEEIKARYK
jgi:hypothetical protein